MMSEDQVREAVRGFVLDSLLMGDPSAMLADSASFLETGTIDSTGVLEIVMFLEQNLKVAVADRELVPENLDSIDRLVRFVVGKQRAA